MGFAKFGKDLGSPKELRKLRHRSPGAGPPSMSALNGS